MKKYSVNIEYGDLDGIDGVFSPHDFIIDTEREIESTEHLAKIIGVKKKYQRHELLHVTLSHSRAEKWLDEHIDEVATITASVGLLLNDNYGKYKDKAYMCCSAGNEDKDGEAPIAEKRWWTPIGAVNPNLEWCDYSSFGKGLVQFVGITDESIPYELNGITLAEFIRGTSFAAPQHQTQIDNLIWAFQTLHGRPPTLKEIFAIRDKYVKDLYTEGKDLKTGYGYYEYKEDQILMVKFTDVDEDDYGKQEIELAASLGLVKGYTDGTFKPNENISRRDSTILMVRMLKKLLPELENSTL